MEDTDIDTLLNVWQKPFYIYPLYGFDWIFKTHLLSRIYSQMISSRAAFRRVSCRLLKWSPFELLEACCWVRGNRYIGAYFHPTITTGDTINMWCDWERLDCSIIPPLNNLGPVSCLQQILCLVSGVSSRTLLRIGAKSLFSNYSNRYCLSTATVECIAGQFVIV